MERSRSSEDDSASPVPPAFPLAEVFSWKKTFFLRSPHAGARRSEIPNLEEDYFPRDEASRKLFSRPSRGDWDCFRGRKEWFWKGVAFSLTAVLVFLLLGFVFCNLIRLKSIERYLGSGMESVWRPQEEVTWGSGGGGADPEDAGVIQTVWSYESGKEEREGGHFERVDTNLDRDLGKIEPFFIRPLDDSHERVVIISDDRDPRNKKVKRSVRGKKEEEEKALGFPELTFSQKLTDLKRKFQMQKENFKTNGKKVFQPFSLPKPEVQSAGFSGETFSQDQSTAFTETEVKYSSWNDNPPMNSPSRDKGAPQDEHLSARATDQGGDDVIPGSSNLSPPVFPQVFSDSQPAEEARSSPEPISLADAIKRRTEIQKKLFLNSRVVGGSSDVRLPTGPDVTKPEVNAFETLKTGQQLSFTPSAASQLIFPYQMCLFASPFPWSKPSIRSIQPRTFSLAPSSLLPSLSQKEPKYFTQPPPQQNFLSVSVNNYAHSPPPQRQQVNFPPTAGSYLNLLPPMSSPQQMHVSNGPLPNSQPIFCTYLQPPLFQFPTVPGTADFSHAKCVDCMPDDDSQPSSLESPIDRGRVALTCSDDTVPCRDGSTCVSVRNWCDNEVHCPDVSDEAFCSCRERVARERLCDGYVDCPHGEDEVGCFGCPKAGFSCDSVITPESCIPLNKRCDGHRDCAIGNDETDCSALFPYVHHNRSHEVGQAQGFLHRNWKGDWFPVCVEVGSDVWAKEACRAEVGYPPAAVEVDFAPVAAYYKGPFIVRNEDGRASLQDHCKGHLSTYVKCPPVKCGTSAGVHNLQEMENRLKRFADGGQKKSKREETGRVVGGRESQPRAWPWAVAIYKDGGFLCGGVVLDRTWVLTAAHCMEQYWKHFYEVRGGMLRRFSFSPMEQIRAVGAVIVHENYNPAIMSNDLALLRLKTPFHFNRWVRPACLPSFGGSISNFFGSPAPGSRCIAVGWGALRERGVDADQLREVEVPILMRCKHKEDLVGAEICAGRAEGGKDTCQGDSGGPLLCRNSRNPSSWYVAGIVSHGEGCARPDEPGAYTRISLFLDWITVNANDFKLPAVKPMKVCPGFRCRSATKLCIPDKWVCNGFTDCLEGEDEKNCTSDLFYNQYLSQLTSLPFGGPFRMNPNSSSIKHSPHYAHVPEEGNLALSSETLESFTAEDRVKTKESPHGIKEPIRFEESKEPGPAAVFMPTVPGDTTEDNDDPEGSNAASSTPDTVLRNDEKWTISDTLPLQYAQSTSRGSNSEDSVYSPGSKLAEWKESRGGDAGTGDIQRPDLSSSDKLETEDTRTKEDASDDSIDESEEVTDNDMTAGEVEGEGIGEEEEGEKAAREEGEADVKGEGAKEEEMETEEDKEMEAEGEERETEEEEEGDKQKEADEAQEGGGENDTEEEEEEKEQIQGRQTQVEETEGRQTQPETEGDAQGSETKGEKREEERETEEGNTEEAKQEEIPKGDDSRISEDFTPTPVEASGATSDHRYFIKQETEWKITTESTEVHNLATEYFPCREIVQSILKEYVCDGIRDCEDGTDEIECSCEDLLQRTDPRSICDGHDDCPDGSDERNCGPCTPQEFHCSQSDTCLPSAVRCDGVPDCPAGEDESRCFALSSNSKLTTFEEPPLETTGLVFSYDRGAWTLLCNGGDGPAFDGKLAAEVCTSLGWQGYYMYENDTISSNCTALRVTCSEYLANDLHHYSHPGTQYLWPWNAFVYADGDLACSAVLLRPQWLLTSPGCIQNISLATTYVVAKLGSAEPESGTGIRKEEQVIRIDAIRVLPGDRAALLHLAQEAPRSRHIRPIGVPYLFDPDPATHLCVAAGEANVFLKFSTNCSQSNLCYDRVTPRSATCKPKTWNGVVVCQSRVGWFPSSAFHDAQGPCGFKNTQFTPLQTDLTLIQAATRESIAVEEESLAKCPGFRCPLGRCIPVENLCDGSPDCPSKKDEDSDTCATKGCKAWQLKCRNGACLPKRLFANGEDDCGDGSDEPETVNCYEYLRLTDPRKICNGKRNCLDKTDENPQLCPCDSTKFKCTSSELCVPEDFVCDGEKDCPGGEDEWRCFGRKRLPHPNSTSFSIMQKSCGTWHDACPPVLRPESADSLCKDLGFEKSDFVHEANQTLLLPAMDPFTRVNLNSRTSVTLRTSRPFVRLRPETKTCARVKCL